MNEVERIEKPIFANAWQLINDNSIDSIVTFCKRLDTILGGGVRLGQITEIIAPAGCGKTQICFQLAVTCQIPNQLGGVEGEVIYIDTENTFNTKRLDAVAQAVVDHCRNIAPNDQEVLASKYLTKENIFNRIHYKKCSTVEQLLDVCSRLESLVKRWNVKLIVVDSVAAPFRYNDAISMEKSLDHLKCQQLLKMRLLQTAIRCHVAVVVTNHVTMRFSKDSKEGFETAALSRNFGCDCASRILLRYYRGNRWAKLIKTSCIYNDVIIAPYCVNEMGIRDTNRILPAPEDFDEFSLYNDGEVENESQESPISGNDRPVTGSDQDLFKIGCHSSETRP